MLFQAKIVHSLEAFFESAGRHPVETAAPVAVVLVHEPFLSLAPVAVAYARVAGLLGAALPATRSAGAGVAALREDGALLAPNRRGA